LSFPLYLHVGPWRLHPHLVFELLAYFVGFQLYLRARRRQGDTLDDSRRWWVIAAAALGAALGARLLYLVDCPLETLRRWHDPAFLFGGKTVVGALAGGWLAVEAAKRVLGVTTRTGDLFAIPLASAIAIGRVGCFLTGPADHTTGLPARVPWAVDFGDGVPRHPAQLYEIAFLSVLVVALAAWRRRGAAKGDLFRGFVAAYFAFRLGIDFLKPAACRGLELSAIQWTCVAALVVLGPDMLRWTRRKRA
jgi:prolipoprotein diacylglyceryltransferase